MLNKNLIVFLILQLVWTAACVSDANLRDDFLETPNLSQRQLDNHSAHAIKKLNANISEVHTPEFSKAFVVTYLQLQKRLGKKFDISEYIISFEEINNTIIIYFDSRLLKNSNGKGRGAELPPWERDYVLSDALPFKSIIRMSDYSVSDLIIPIIY